MKQRGYTLIELMIVIVIVGVLLSLAIPTYRDYVVRARVMEGINLATTAKLAVNEYVMNHGVLPEVVDDALFQPPPATVNVLSITLANKTADVVIVYAPQAGDGTLILHPTLDDSHTLSWSCQGGTLAKRYRPSLCK